MPSRVSASFTGLGNESWRRRAGKGDLSNAGFLSFAFFSSKYLSAAGSEQAFTLDPRGKRVGYCGNSGRKAVFSGRFDHAIDEKGRVSIPARFREKLPSSEFLYITNFRSDRQPCLRLYAPEEWERLLGRLKQKSSFNPDIQRFQLFFIGGAHDVPIDAQGRILIPPKLREFARLERDVTFSGMSEHFELWDRGTLSKVLDEAEATFDDPERMKEIDL